MSFNKNAFAASFLNQLTAGIEEREEKAEEYERQQKAAAERNAAIVSTRKLRRDEAVQLANKARTLGARPEHIAAAMSSGMTGISQLYQKLQDAANQLGVRKLGEADIEAIVNMPVVPPINGELVDFNIRELADKTFGVAKLDKAKEPEPSGNVLRRLFGLDDMAVARRRLQDTEYVEGMSIADINEAARQAEYRSLFPDLGFTLMDVEFYGPSAKGKFLSEAASAVQEATTGRMADTYVQMMVDDLIASKKEGEKATPQEVEAVRKAAREELGQKALQEIVIATASRYGRGGFFNDPETVDLIRKGIGDKFLIEQANIYEKELELEEDQTTEPTNTEQNKEKIPSDVTPNKEEDTKKEKTPTENKKEEILTETYPTRPTGVSRKERKKGEQWDSKYKGKVDPATGKALVVEPRPSEEITTVKGKGRRQVTVSAAKEWDKKYADTHEPNGLPKL